MLLPSLKSIEAFESAAQYLNFTKAGTELNLTSAAISQRVTSLEDALGYELFERHGPKLKLTEMGEICRPRLIQALSQMRASISSLQEIAGQRVLTVKVSPSFAQKWLIPRLGRFYLNNPKVDLRVWSTTDSVRINQDELCSAIYYGINPSDGILGNQDVDYLFKERVFPVCSPEYYERNLQAFRQRNIQQLVLLHDDTMKPMRSFPDWQRWCEAFGLEDVNTNHGPRFVVSSIAIQAAVEGQGIVLARGALVRDDVRSGKLITPFDDVYPFGFDYLFVYPKILSQNENFNLFLKWLLDEARQHVDEAVE